MPVVDDLQIRIQGDAVKANDAIDKLIGKLDRLSTALSGLSGKNLSSLSTGVTRLSGAMTAMNNVKTADFTRLATNITKLADLDAGRIGQAAGAMNQFANSLESLNNVRISDKAQQIAELSKGIAQLGYKSSTKAIENIPQLAQGMANLMTTLSKAPKVSQNLIDMTNALARLSRTGSSSGKAANSLSSALNRYTASTTRAKKGTFSLASAIGKLYATYWLLFRAFGKIRDAIDISSQLTEVQNVVDVTFGKYASLVDKMSEISINEFGMSELTVKQVASRFQAMGTAMGFAQGEMADMSIELTKLTADMASFYNVEQDAVAEDLAAIFTGQTRPLRQYGIDLTQATLQEWALKQGMDANIKSMSQAEKTMLRYQYVLANTGAAQGDFLRTVDTWANQTRILKENFRELGTVIGKTFINMLKPLVKALNSAMAHVIAFAKTVSNALGKIFGWKYEEGDGGVVNDMEYAADSSEDLAGGLSDAEKNAKKLKSHLLGIDELNVLEPDTGDSASSSGGGAGGTGGASADGGQWVKSESILKSFESELDTLYKLGEHIGNKLSEAMEKIDWKKTYKKAENWGKGLADFLNGLISPRLFSNLGKTVAGSLNTSLYFLNSFGRTFEWEEFGYSLSSGLRGFLETWDAELTSATFSTAARGILQSLTGAIDGLREEDVFNQIGQKIVDFICGIDWLGITWDLGGLLWSLAKAIIGLPIDLVSGILEGGTKQLSQAFVDKIFGEGNIEIDWSNFSFKEEFVNAFGFDEIATFFSEWWEGVKERWSVAWEEDIKPWFTIERWSELANGILDGISLKWNELKVWWSETALVTWWEEDVSPWFTSEKWAGLYETIKTSLKSVWDETVGQWITDVGTWWNVNVAPWFTKKKWSDMLKNIPTVFKEAFKGAANFAIDMLNGVIEGIESLVNRAIEGLKELANMVNKVPGVNIDISGWGISLPRIPRFESGGFPERASLFWAGEYGTPEILGTVGGRTAVASGTEITGIRDAVYDTGETEASLLRTAVSLLEIIASKEMSVNISDRDVAMANRRGEEKLGYNFNF